MTDREYYEGRLEETRRVLMGLIAKVECPNGIGYDLSNLLIETVDKIEELQEESHAMDRED